jgi:hypothetical protein
MFLMEAERPAFAAVAEPSEREDEAFDFMNFLSHRGLHDLHDEYWNAYGQTTDIYSLKLPFTAPYSGFKSLSNKLEFSFTETATLYVGLRLWPGGEAYIVPELIAERPLSNLQGLGSTIQNFELQKQGVTTPSPYLSRGYIRQTFGFGGGHDDVDSNPMQLGHQQDRRRLVVTFGNYSVIDFFDKNDVAGDLRRSFFNMAFLTYAAFDFAADARGYTWGAMAELFYEEWAVRAGRFIPPKAPNQLPLDFRPFDVYGDQVEIEHHHTLGGHPGAVHLLGYRNVEFMGRFDDAVARFRSNPAAYDADACNPNVFSYGSPSTTAPDLCFVRWKNEKLGIGVAAEQEITRDVGAFVRGMYSDGQTEVYSYTSTDQSFSAAVVARGTSWHRGADTTGFGWGQGWISKSHAEYLGLGGVDGFIGDGRIRHASEQVVEAYYSLSLGTSAWFSVDYQHIWNPAYNADRGPVDIFGARMHLEF